MQSRSDRITLVVISGLAVLRTLTYLIYGPLHFDSDQAILGLMAIDLSHLDALPIVVYGQTYMLGVIAWLAAPLFAMFGPSIAALKAPFVAINVAAVAGLYFTLRRQARLGVFESALASATVAMPTVVMAQSFMNASGGHVEPVLYVTMCYLLRDRRLALPLFSAFAVAHREVMASALVALVLVDGFYAIDRRASAVKWVRAGVVFAVALMAIRWSAAAWSTNYGGLVAEYSLTADVAASLAWLARDSAIVLGLGDTDLRGVGFIVSYHEGSIVTMVAIGALALLAVVSVAARPREAARRESPLAFAAYLCLSCFFVALAFAGRRMAHDTLLVRYLFLLVLVPAALAAAALSVSAPRVVRFAVCLALAWVVVSNSLANIGYYSATRAARIPDRMGAVAAFVESRGLTTGAAPYWTAYDLAFRTGGRVHVASTEFVRIPRYQAEYTANKTRAFTIGGDPCERGTPVTIRGTQVCVP